MERTLINDTINKTDEKTRVCAWVFSRRDHGKIVFFDLKDRSGILQAVAMANIVESDIREGYILDITGTIQKRPEKLVNPEMPTGSIEMQIEEIKIISKAEVYPFTIKEMDVNYPVLMDFRPLTLRNDKIKSIFKVQENLIDGFRKTLKGLDFTEFQTPAIVGQAPEGGSELFHIDYYDYNAYLAQSPQIYKQILTGVYERVFTVCKAFRAEPSATTRHLSEYISLDAEMGFIQSWEDVMEVCEKTIKGMMQNVTDNCLADLKLHNAQIPDLTIAIPKIKLREAQEIVGADKNEPDLSPEDERNICQWAKEKYNSDFIFVTHFPTKKRPFYTHPDPEDLEHTLGFDLLFRGLEIITGGQRINDYEQLVSNIKKWGNKEEDFSFYLQTFKFGMPPEGGFAIGTERVTKQLLGLDNVGEASLFPRDMERIDQRLSDVQTKKSKKE